MIRGQQLIKLNLFNRTNVILAISLFLLIGGCVLWYMRILITLREIIIIIGLIGSIASILQLLMSIPRTYKTRIIKRVSLKHSDFVDRKSEFMSLVKKVEKGTHIVNVFGDKGVGKSELLRVFVDAVNNYITRTIKLRLSSQELVKLQKLKKALYFDLSDNTGIEDIMEDICRKTFHQVKPEYEYFLQCLNTNYSQYSFIHVLDNLNNPALKFQINQLIQLHWSVRPEDTFVIGSIDQFDVYTIPYTSVELLPFKEKAVKEYAVRKGKKLEKTEINEILKISNGLPIYLELILNSQYTNLESHKIITSIKSFLLNQIFPNLDKSTMDVLIIASFLNLVITEISTNTLLDLKIDGVHKCIYNLKRYSLIITNSNTDVFKVHDRVRDIVLDLFSSCSSEINNNISNYYLAHGRNKEAVIHLLHSNILISNTDIVIKTLLEETEKENLPFLLTAGSIFEKTERAQRLLNLSADFKNTILFSHLFSVLGHGNYIEANRIVELIVFGSTGIPRLDEINSLIEFDIYFLVADLDHLLNRYSLSIDGFRRLLNIADKKGYENRISRCLWGIAHSYRHQGKELNNAIYFYKKCAETARSNGDIRYLCKALNGEISISLITGNTNTITDSKFEEIYKTVHKNTIIKTELASTMKYHSIYLRLIGNYPLAIQYINNSYEILNKLGKRTVYNLEFEYGEYYRCINDYEKACKKYKNVLFFSDKNNDRNLKVNSLLGITLAELSSDSFIVNKNSEEQCESVIQAMEIAMEADIHITYLQARIILDYLQNKCDISLSPLMPDMVKYLKRLGLFREAKIYENMCEDKLSNMHLILL